jgi:hypothetical protein
MHSPWRAAVTARAGLPITESMNDGAARHAAVKTEEQQRLCSPSMYLWAMLLARIYEVFPLVCPRCAEPMTIIAFLTEAVSIKRILEHIGEPTTPPPIAPARGPPQWEDDIDQTPVYDSTAQLVASSQSRSLPGAAALAPIHSIPALSRP